MLNWPRRFGGEDEDCRWLCSGSSDCVVDQRSFWGDSKWRAEGDCWWMQFHRLQLGGPLVRHHWSPPPPRSRLSRDTFTSWKNVPSNGTLKNEYFCILYYILQWARDNKQSSFKNFQVESNLDMFLWCIPGVNESIQAAMRFRSCQCGMKINVLICYHTKYLYLELFI